MLRLQNLATATKWIIFKSHTNQANHLWHLWIGIFERKSKRPELFFIPNVKKF